jgi:hypothetical protein
MPMPTAGMWPYPMPYGNPMVQPAGYYPNYGYGAPMNYGYGAPMNPGYGGPMMVPYGLPARAY